MLININTIFKNAVIEENIDTLEKILSSSDTRINLIEEFAKHYDMHMLTTIIPKFRSKGLIANIEEYCDLISSRNIGKDSSNNFESSVVRYVHKKNMEQNKLNYLQEDTFSKNRI